MKNCINTCKSISLHIIKVEGGFAMLGVNVKREPVRGKFAREIRERMRRILSEELNENDKKEIRKHKQIMKGITVVWK